MITKRGLALNVWKIERLLGKCWTTFGRRLQGCGTIVNHLLKLPQLSSNNLRQIIGKRSKSNRKVVEPLTNNDLQGTDTFSRFCENISFSTSRQSESTCYAVEGKPSKSTAILSHLMRLTQDNRASFKNTQHVPLC